MGGQPGTTRTKLALVRAEPRAGPLLSTEEQLSNNPAEGLLRGTTACGRALTCTSDP